MPVLRSREILPQPNLSSTKTLEKGFIEPSTPSKIAEPLGIQTTPTPISPDFDSMSSPVPNPSRRRSIRLSSKSNFEENFLYSSSNSSNKRRRNGTVGKSTQFDFNNLCSVSMEESSVRVSEFDVKLVDKSPNKMMRKSSDYLEEIEEKEEIGFLSLRSGTKVVKKIAGGSDNDNAKEKGILIQDDDGDIGFENGIKMAEDDTGFEDAGKMDEDVSSLNNLNEKMKSPRRRFTREEKGKGLYSNGGFQLGDIDLNFPVNIELNSHMGGLFNEMEEDTSSSFKQKDEQLKSPTRFTREQKGKGVMLDDDSDLDNVDVDLDLKDDMCNQMGGSENEMDDDDIDDHQNAFARERSKNLMKHFKKIAKRNAFKYAHYNEKGEERNQVNSEAGVEMPPEQAAVNVEDWPGPFSTAMKIIRDREQKMHFQVSNSSSGKGGFPLVSWTPRDEKDPQCLKRDVPSLQSLCVKILVKNVDAISSLEWVPDAIRNKLSQMLCDSRQMNPHFLSLLLDGSPSEIRLADCSWLDESVFEKSFEACNTKNLMVLQLDLGGHCISDSSLRKALVPKEMKTLTTISLKGACRISDVGLAALVSSAPALRSINLSQCSLLTDVGIDSIANVVGSLLQELYLDDCDTLDATSILPILKRLKSLEVLSLRGIVSVSDKFVRELIDANGHNMKELVLANCVNLTDSSLKVIAEKCSQLCVLDLSYLSKLTDIGMAHLGNGCHRIQDLKLCRSPFSDEAIAAFLESAGESLKELSLNNIKKVGQNTTISLSRRCKNLEILDVSWCRLLTDEALGLIADSCSSLRVLKVFGCTQVTSVFLDGHSNAHLQIVGLKLTPILEHIKRPDFLQGPLHYSAVPPS